MKMLVVTLAIGSAFWLGVATAPRQPVIVKITKVDPTGWPIAESMGCDEVARSCRASARMSKVIQAKK